MTGRRYCTPAEKEALCEAQNGMCAICGEPLGLGPTHYDHEIPNAIRAGKPTQALHASCHAMKTKVDRKVIAKTKRQARLAAIRTLTREVRKRQIQSRPFPNIKRALSDLKWKRKINGPTVRRIEQ